MLVYKRNVIEFLFRIKKSEMEIINSNFFNVKSSVLLYIALFLGWKIFGENKNKIRNKN